MLWWFAETSLVAGLLAALAAGFSRLRPIAPTTRHLLWLAVLIKFLTPPIVSSPWAFARPEAILPAAEPTAVTPLAPAAHAPAVEAAVAPRVVLASWPPDVEDRKPTLAATSVSRPARTSPAFTISPDAVRWWLLRGWFLGTSLVALVQAARIQRFHLRLRRAVPAPGWLVDEADAVAERLGVRPPEMLAVADLGTPMIWCLGTPRLLVPARLLKSLAADQWRGVLAHELAHLRRGDHWVRRLELASELVWWWNPLYWAARRRLDAEAELACDAWVVSTMPDDRLTYAQVLLKICSELSQTKSPAPALSVAGSGPFFERRLNMILRDQAPCRTSPTALVGVCILSLAALPSWTLATTPSPAAPVVATSDEDDKKKEKDARQKDKDESIDVDADVDIDVDLSDLDKTIEKAFGPDFEKSMEEFGEAFGEEFAAKMEAFGEEMEKRFGDDSDFAKHMEAFGEEMEKKFGEGSEFAKKMEEFGKKMEEKFGENSDFAKEVEKKFGENSDFAKKMEARGKEMEKKFGPGSEFEAKTKKAAEKAKADQEREAAEEAASPDAKQKARKLLHEAREQILHGKYDLAAKKIGEAESIDVKWGLFDDTPTKARAALAKTKVDAKSAKAAKDKIEKTAAEERAKVKIDAKTAKADKHEIDEARRAAAEHNVRLVEARQAREAERKAREADRAKRQEDRKASSADRKARLKQLEAKLRELAKEIQALESEDSDEE
jgi:beta-lactamase regulating signal transducer with metallopeptidase domain